MIKFSCLTCGHQMQVPDKHVGKKGKCPKCGGLVTIGTSKLSETVDSEDSSIDLEFQSGPFAKEPSTYEVSSGESGEKSSEIEDYISKKTAEASPGESELIPTRKLPWLIDVLLYPISLSGMIVIGMIITFEVTFYLAMMMIGVFALVLFIFHIILFIYLYWYYAQCVRDSCEGGLRAPETINISEGLWEMFVQLLKIIFCGIVFLGPAKIYFQFTDEVDIIFWSFLCMGIFLFPMGLLGVILFDSLSALNPILIIGSIIRAFIPYCGLVVLLGGIAWMITNVGADIESVFLEIFIEAFHIYFLMVFSHLLGRFFFKYQKRLDWGV